MSDLNRYDVVIVGGGPAGLSAAVILGRSLRRVLVIDAGEPRNAVSPAAHNFLGQEGVNPIELLAQGRREAESFGVKIRSRRAVSARRHDDDLVIGLDDGSEVVAGRLLLAVGVRDDLPGIEGLERFWGTSVLHCPFCHGWEVRGRRIGVIATGSNAPHQAQLFRQLSEDVTVILHDVDELPAEARERLTARDIRIVDATITRVTHESGALTGVELEDGTLLAFDALVVGPKAVQRAEIFEQLGGSFAEHPFGGAFIEADPLGRTTIPGVWAIGNTSDLGATVAVAAAAGVRAGGAIHAELVEQEIEAAVASARGR